MNHPEKIVVISHRLYHLLLMICHSEFRRRYGWEMGQVFRDRCRESWQRGGLAGLVWWWVSALVDLAGTAFATHVDAFEQGEVEMKRVLQITTQAGGIAPGPVVSTRQDQDKKAPATNQSIIGDWSVTIAEFGEKKQTLGPIPIKLKVEGEKLTGVFVTPRMGDVPLENLKFDGEALCFKVSNGEQYFEFDLKMSGKKFEGKMTASVSKMSGKAIMTRKE